MTQTTSTCSPKRHSFQDQSNQLVKVAEVESTSMDATKVNLEVSSHKELGTRDSKRLQFALRTGIFIPTRCDTAEQSCAQHAMPCHGLSFHPKKWLVVLVRPCGCGSRPFEAM
jgi:hypothetical protein